MICWMVGVVDHHIPTNHRASEGWVDNNPEDRLLRSLSTVWMGASQRS